MASALSAVCRYSYIFIALSALLLVLTPFTIVFLNADPGISAFYRRALSMSEDSKSPKHPMVTLVDNSDNLAAQGLHSHDNKTNEDAKQEKQPSAAVAATKEQNKTVSNVMMASPDHTTPEFLVNDIHDASAQIVKDWGLGWDSKISRVVQVLLGLSIYFVVMVIKGFIISWGIGQVQDQLRNTGQGGAGNTDILANLVNLAVNNLAAKFGN